MRSGQYLRQRLVQWAAVVLIGVTATFVIPRLGPMDPVQSTLNQMIAFGGFMEASAVEKMKETLQDLYGLRGNLLQQYVRFWARLATGDLGPSFSQFPRPVTEVIASALPWTGGLLLFSTVVAWVIGLVVGGLAGYWSDRRWARVVDVIVMVIYPIPYYIMAFAFVMLFTYILPLFPSVGGAGIGMKASFSLRYLGSVLHHAALPAASLVIVTIGWRFLSMKAMVSTVVGSDYVAYAEAARLPRRKILFGYVMRNTLLPQITDLALSLGAIFSGALVTEYVFSYPGIGQVLYTAILHGDYNLVMGITVFSIVGIATAALLIDLTYPLFDPRIRRR
jgi:peptide/nickel transport system permease protein